MKTKAKKFSHKLLALFMAVLMAASCFTGALTAYADTMSSEKTYADDSIEYNDLAWAILSDEQVATALLDYADLMLAEYGPQIDKLLETFHQVLPSISHGTATAVHLSLMLLVLLKKTFRYVLTVLMKSSLHLGVSLIFLINTVTYSVMPATLTLRLLPLRIGVFQEKLHLQLIF